MIKYKITNNNLHLIDSYEVRTRNLMNRNLVSINTLYPDHPLFINRTHKSMIREWRDHNLLYDLGISRERTKDCDLNYPQKWYVKIGYAILSIFYIP